MKSYIKDNFTATIRAFFLFSASISYCEFILRFLILEEGLEEPAFLLFVPAQALLFTLFCGFSKRQSVNRGIKLFIILLISLFYIVQLLYYRQFGSPLSVSFIKMGGEAMADFWWSFKATLLKSVRYILILLVPFITYAAFFYSEESRSGKISFIYRLFVLLMTFALGAGAVSIAKLGGSEKHSAYYVLKNAYSDTETSALKLGMLTTSLVESGAYFLGINSNGDTGSFTTQNVDFSALSSSFDDFSSKTSDSLAGDEGHTSPENNGALSEKAPEIAEIKKHINEGIDFSYLKSLTEDSDIQALCDYFAQMPAAEENEYTGLFEGCNLIYICAESFTTYAMNEKITPLLCKMAQSGIVLNNFYSSFKNTTTNGEFAYSVSLWPDVSRKAADGNAVGSFACSSSNYMPYGLGNIFNEINVPTYAFHGYISSYYRRCDSWPNLGYRNMKFMYEGLEFDNKWSPTDTELMEQTLDDFVSDERFFTYYMTYSGHGDYTTDTYIYLKNQAKVRELLGDDYYTDAEISYYCGSYELELALEYLIDKLSENGQLDKTVIVLAGDHIPYNLTDEDMKDMSLKAGMEYDNSFEKYKSTCIIYNAAMEEAIVSDAYCCTVDILPTVLNLMGIDYDSRLIAGNDIFDSSLQRARLYNGNLLTEYVNYDASRDKAVWKGRAEDWDESQKNEYLEILTAYSDNEYKVSLKMMEKDFYRFVWDNLKGADDSENK